MAKSSIDDILARIDAVIAQNRRIETTFIALSIILFLCGIACFVTALATQKFAWSTPSAITTGLLYWPLQQIKGLRRENIALATAPILITQLPPDKAAEEIQKLLRALYGPSNE